MHVCKLSQVSEIALELVEYIPRLTSLNNSCCNINIESIKKMTNLLKHNPASNILKISNSKIRTDALSTLVSDRW